MKYLFLIILPVVLFGAKKQPWDEAVIALLPKIRMHEFAPLKKKSYIMKQKIDAMKMKPEEIFYFSKSAFEVSRQICQEKLDSVLSLASEHFSDSSDREDQFVRMMSTVDHLRLLLAERFNVQQDECYRICSPYICKKTGGDLVIMLRQDCQEDEDNQDIFYLAQILKWKKCALDTHDFLFFSEVPCQECSMMQNQYSRLVRRFSHEFRIFSSQFCPEMQNMGAPLLNTQDFNARLKCRVIEKIRAVHITVRIALSFCYCLENQELAIKKWDSALACQAVRLKRVEEGLAKRAEREDEIRKELSAFLMTDVQGKRAMFRKHIKLMQLQLPDKGQSRQQQGEEVMIEMDYLMLFVQKMYNITTRDRLEGESYRYAWRTKDPKSWIVHTDLHHSFYSVRAFYKVCGHSRFFVGLGIILSSNCQVIDAQYSAFTEKFSLEIQSLSLINQCLPQAMKDCLRFSLTFDFLESAESALLWKSYIDHLNFGDPPFKIIL